MCRSIKTLRRPQPAVADQEVTAAALQFVRKISGFRQPSKANQVAFDSAVQTIAGEVRKLLDALPMQERRKLDAAVIETVGGDMARPDLSDS